MKFNKSFYIIFLIFISLFFISCGKGPDCSEFDTTYKTYTYNPETKSCQISSEVEPNKCQNGIMENGETYCNCPKDVPKIDPINGCDGMKGEYLEYQCNNQKCVLLPIEKEVILQTRQLSYLKDSYITLEAEVQLDDPLIVNLEPSLKKDSIIVITLEARTMKEGVTDLTIDKIKILDSSNMVLSSIDVSSTLNTQSTSKIVKRMSLNPTNSFKSLPTLKVEVYANYVYHRYDSKGEEISSEDKNVILKDNIGRWTIINAQKEVPIED